MESTIWLADGFVVITGEIGSGKTTLIESFLEELPDNVELAYISQTQLSAVEFLQSLLVEFGFKPFDMKKVELLAQLKSYMIEKYAEGKTLLLVVDEAQNLSRRVLEEIRLLSGVESQKEKLLRIIFAGQPELSDKLDAPALVQLAQRVRLRFHLAALSRRETKEYIEHRLQVAGAENRQLFDDDTYDVIFAYSGGVPRLINVLCDTAMLCAFAEDSTTVSRTLINTAVAELQWVPFEERVTAESAVPNDLRTIAKKQKSAPAPVTDDTVASPTFGYFELMHGTELISTHAISPGRLVIGRTPDNDIQIPSKFVSRHHAQVTTDDSASVISDLNSTNGVYIGASRVNQHELTDGDSVQIGKHLLVFRDMRAETGRHEQNGTQILADDTLEATGFSPATTTSAASPESD